MSAHKCYEFAFVIAIYALLNYKETEIIIRCDSHLLIKCSIAQRFKVAVEFIFEFGFRFSLPVRLSFRLE